MKDIKSGLIDDDNIYFKDSKQIHTKSVPKISEDLDGDVLMDDQIIHSIECKN